MDPTRLPKLSFPLFPFFLSVLLFPSILTATDDLAGNPIRLVTDSSRPSRTHLLLNAEEHFHEFLKRFNKKYSGPEEYKRRFSIFKSNLLKAMHHQALNPTAIHGITKFSDLTEEEFSSMYLGLHQIPREFSRLEPAPVLRTDDLPESFDWRESGAVTPVKDQGSCGSCWSFSAAGALEGAHFLKTAQLLNLSQQQLADCDHEVVFKEEDYPYRGIEGTCKFDKSIVAAKMANFSIVSAAANLIKHGPLSGLNFVVGDVMNPSGFLSNPTRFFNTQVHVNKFYMDYYDNGEVSQFYTDLSLFDLGGKEVMRKTISVNVPLRFGGFTIYQTDWGFSALQVSKNNEGPFNLAMAPLQINGDKKHYGTFLPLGDPESSNVKGM